MTTLMYHGRICKDGYSSEWSRHIEHDGSNSDSRYSSGVSEDEKRHTLTVTITEAESCVTDFYLINVIGKLQQRQ